MVVLFLFLFFSILFLQCRHFSVIPFSVETLLEFYGPDSVISSPLATKVMPIFLGSDSFLQERKYKLSPPPTIVVAYLQLEKTLE